MKTMYMFLYIYMFHRFNYFLRYHIYMYTNHCDSDAIFIIIYFASIYPHYYYTVFN